jgi:hypothetical protein
VILRRRAEGNAGAGGTEPASAPIFDYTMIDDDFMLAPVVAPYLLDLLDTPGARAVPRRS